MAAALLITGVLGGGSDDPNLKWIVTMAPTLISVGAIAVLWAAWVIRLRLSRWRRDHEQPGSVRISLPSDRVWTAWRLASAGVFAVAMVVLLYRSWLNRSSILIDPFLSQLEGIGVLLLVGPTLWLLWPILDAPVRLRLGARFLIIHRRLQLARVIPLAHCQVAYLLRDNQRRLKGVEFVLPAARAIQDPLSVTTWSVTSWLEKRQWRDAEWRETIIFRPALGEEGERLVDGLREAGVSMETRLLLLDAEEPWAIVRHMADVAFCIVMLVVCWYLALVTMFWVNWNLFGGMNTRYSFFTAMPIGLLYLAALVLLGPLRGWLWKTGELIFVRSPFNVILAEGFARPGAPALTTTRAWVETDGDSLLFHFMGRRLRIRRRDLTNLGMEKLRWSQGGILGYRYSCQPIAIQWLTEEAAEHRILIHVSNRGTLASDHWATDRLYAYLCRWRDGDGADLRPLRKNTRRRALPALLLSFAVLGLIPVIHNHTLLTNVRTGRWKPNISGPLEMARVRRVGPSIAAVDPRKVLLLESAPVFGVPRWWRLDLETQTFMFLGFEADVMLAQPGEPSAMLTASLNPYSYQLIPPGLPLRLNRLMINVSDGTVREVDWLPDQFLTPQGALTQAGSVVMTSVPRPTGRSVAARQLGGFPFNSLRDFSSRDVMQTDGFTIITRPLPMASQERTEEQEVDLIVYTPMLWLGGQRGTARGVGSPSLLCFPMGRHVLAYWTVVDLADGTTRPVQLPPGIDGSLHWWGRALNAFPLGDSLGLRVCLEVDGVLINEVWRLETDGNCHVMARLPSTDYLLSVDGDRWLIARLREGIEPLLLLRRADDPAAAERALFPGSLSARYTLIAGEDQILVTESTGGIMVRDFDGLVLRRLE